MEQRHWLGHAFEFVVAALLNDEKTGNLSLHTRCDKNCTWLGQRLDPSSDVGWIAVNLARRIDHYFASFNPYARVKRWLAENRILAVHLGESALDRERGPRRAFSVVFLCYWITEQYHQSVAQPHGDMAAHLLYRPRGGIKIGANQIAPILSIELRGNAGRAHQITEHHCEVAALADLAAYQLSQWRLRRCRIGIRKLANGAKHFQSIAEWNCEFFKVLIGQLGKNCKINAIFSKTLHVLGHVEFFEPVGNLLHGGPGLNFHPFGPGKKAYYTWQHITVLQGGFPRPLRVNHDRAEQACRSSHVRNAPLATVGQKKAAYRDGPIRDIGARYSITSSA